MTKHYCDRCGRECNSRDLTTIKIPKAKTIGGFDTYELDACRVCKKEYDNLLDTLTDIRFLMFEKFFVLKGE